MDSTIQRNSLSINSMMHIRLTKTLQVASLFPLSGWRSLTPFTNLTMTKEKSFNMNLISHQSNLKTSFLLSNLQIKKNLFFDNTVLLFSFYFISNTFFFQIKINLFMLNLYLIIKKKWIKKKKKVKKSSKNSAIMSFLHSMF